MTHIVRIDLTLTIPGTTLTPEQMARGACREAEQTIDAHGDIGRPWIAWKPMLEVYADAGWIEPHHLEAGERMLELGLQAGRRDLVTHRSLDGLRRGQGDGAAQAGRELRDIERAIGPRYLAAVDAVVFRGVRAPRVFVAAGLERAARAMGMVG